MMKKKYAEMTAAERQAEYTAVQREYEDAKALHLALNMARGKPGREQLELVMPIRQRQMCIRDRYSWIWSHPFSVC